VTTRKSIFSKTQPWTTSSNSTDRALWIALALDAGFEGLRTQRDEMNGIRTRALAFFATTIAGSGFFLAKVVDALPEDRNPGMIALLVTGYALSLAQLLLVLVTVMPRVNFEYILRPKSLVEWMTESHGAPSREAAMVELVNTQTTMIERNRKSLQKIRRRYFYLLVVSVGVIIYWSSALWVFI